MIWNRINHYKKWVILLIVAAALGGGGAYYLKKNSTPVVAGTTAVIGRGDVIEAISATGTISAVNSVDISSRVTGLISELRVQENDMVKKDRCWLCWMIQRLKHKLPNIRLRWKIMRSFMNAVKN